MERRALFFRDSDPLEKIVNSTRRLAIALELNNWKIGWIWGPLPNTIINRIRGSRTRLGINEYILKGRWLSNKVWTYVPFIYKPYLRHILETDIQKLLLTTVPSLKNILQNNDFYDVEILCVATPIFLSASSICNYKLLIYHCPVPFWRIYAHMQDIFRANMKLLDISDIIIVPSIVEKEDLIRNFMIDRKKIEVIEHGATITYQENKVSKEGRSGIAIVGIPETTDIDLIKRLAANMREYEFKIIGPFPRHIKRDFRFLRNVRFYGLLDHDKVMDILVGSKVGLICYRKEIYKNRFSSNTMKLFDYVGAGLPVVSVPLIGDVDMKGGEFLIHADTANSFLYGIEYCMENFEELSKASIEFAKNNSWERRYRQFIDLVSKYI